MKKSELIESLSKSAPDTFLPVKAVIKMIKSIDESKLSADHVQLVTENVLAELIKEGSIKRVVKKVVSGPTGTFPLKKYLRRGDVKEIAKMAHTHQSYVSAIINGRKPQPKVLAIAERFVREKYASSIERDLKKK
jgi:hypothetical protein